MTDRPSVLFLCVHNAGRSQMARGFAHHLSGGAVDVFSGGSEPANAINPVAVDAMAEVGIDITAERPRRWTDDIVRNVAVRLREDPRIAWFQVEAVNQESIHNHSAFARVTWRRPQ